MVSMESNSDDWIASVASYVRNNFGNRGAFVTPEQVRRLREATQGRTEPWTQAELAEVLPKPLENTRSWKLTASANVDGCTAATDGSGKTRWDTQSSQTAGQWFQIELPAEMEVAGLRLDAAGSVDDYPRGYKVQLSRDGQTWGSPVAEGQGRGALTDIPFPRAKTRFIRITQTGSAEGKYWSIHELAVLQSSGKF